LCRNEHPAQIECCRRPTSPVSQSFPTGLIMVAPPFSSRHTLDLGTRFRLEMICTCHKLIFSLINGCLLAADLAIRCELL